MDLQPIKNVFIAYPAQPLDIGETINAFVALAERTRQYVFRPWSQLPIFGANITDQIIQAIETSDVLIADVTVLNHNVLYELGYAIGRKREVVPILNGAFKDALKHQVDFALLDTTGLLIYEDAQDLADKFLNLKSFNSYAGYATEIDPAQPLLVIEPEDRSEFINNIISCIKESIAFFHSYDPRETPRLPLTRAIREVSSSSGVIIPLLSSHYQDSSRHNLLSAFIAGLSHGFDRHTLLIQNGDQPIPADYRDFVKQIRDTADIRSEVFRVAQDAVRSLQKRQKGSKKKNERPLLWRLSLGGIAAESEFRTLGEYFLDTNEFKRALKKEGTLVVGRKGSGKSAIFFQVRDARRERKQEVVLDLKPETYQLQRFREIIVDLLSQGVLDHTLNAFWQFIIYSEIVYKISENDEPRARRNPESLKKLNELISTTYGSAGIPAGDFSERLYTVISHLAHSVNELTERGERVDQERLTNILYKLDISLLRRKIASYLSDKRPIFLLIDNLDKGWPVSGVDQYDIRVLRSLLDALGRAQRDFATLHVDFDYLVFLRNDVYEHLLENTADRGKEGLIRVDWTDVQLLKKLLWLRFVYSGADEGLNFETFWAQQFALIVEGKHSFDYILERSLMRPRLLIDLVQRCIGVAVNRGHSFVEVDDIKEACYGFSLDLISELGFEIRDVFDVTADIFYFFIGIGKHVSRARVLKILAENGVSNDKLKELFNLLVWFGFLGVVGDDSKEFYIYNFRYDWRRIRTEIERIPDSDERFCVNSAFIDGLRSQMI